MKLKELDKEQLNDLIVKLRFQKQEPRKAKFGCMTYQAISKIVRKSTEYC